MPPPDADPQALSEALARRRMDIMVAQVKSMRWPFVLISGVMAMVAARAVPVPVVVAWFAAVLVTFVLRELWLTRQLASPDVRASRMMKGAIISNLAIGIGYGITAAFMAVLDETASAVLTTIAVSSAAGAVAISGTLPPVYLAYTLGIMVPFAAAWALNGTLIGLALAGLMLIFVVLQYRFSRKLSETFNESYQMRRENEALVAQLTIARDEAREAEAKAQAANVAKTRFLAAASHDLRQPMHALWMQSATLKQAPYSEHAPAIADAIADSVSDVNALLNSLLDISKLDAGTLVADKRPIHLSRMLQSLARSEFQPRAESRGLSFELDIVPEQIAVTDLILLKRVLSNLVDNAIKFTPQGRVRVSLSCETDHFELSVADTGVGIPAELQAMVFDEFYQVNRHAEGHAQGLGLGLSIVSRLSELLGMQVRLASTPGVGTTVSLRMPRSSEDVLPPAPDPAPNVRPRLAGLRVLVLDDEATNCQAEASLLRGWGCEVATALDSAQARETALSFSPDVVLADYRLGNDENGIEAIAMLRDDHPDLRALLLSGDTGPDRLREAHHSGLRLLSKPVNPDELKQALSDLVVLSP